MYIYRRIYRFVYIDFYLFANGSCHHQFFSDPSLGSLDSARDKSR